MNLMPDVANVLQRVAVCCSVWQCVAVSRIELRLRKAD